MAITRVSDYGNYPNKVDINQIQQKMQQGNKRNAAVKNDTLDISKAGREALANKMSALGGIGKNAEIRRLSSVSSQSMINNFEKAVSLEKAEDVKSNTFDEHINQMVSAYDSMKRHIEEKYADMGREQQYYVADDGSIQELTKEKELEMLDNAYAKHSEFMAATTEIWSSLQDFKSQIAYHANNGTKEQAASADNTKKGEIKKQAYQAFMSAVNDENRQWLLQEKEGFQLNLAISVSVRKELNGIWDYYKN